MTMDSNEYSKLAKEIENKFKMAQVLEIRKDELAVSKFQDVCMLFENMFMNQSSYPVDTQYLVVPLKSLAEHYENQKLIDKSLRLYTIRRKFLEFFTQNHELASNVARFVVLPNDSPLREDAIQLFNELHEAFQFESLKQNQVEIDMLINEFRKQCEEENLEKARVDAKILKEIAKIQKKNTSTFDALLMKCEEDQSFLIGFFLLCFLITLIPLLYFYVLYTTDVRKNIETIKSKNPHIPVDDYDLQKTASYFKYYLGKESDSHDVDSSADDKGNYDDL